MHMHNCKCVVCQPIVHPTKCCTNHTCTNYVVPHIHPSHTTNVNHEFYAHQHYYPHTQSFQNEVSHQHFNAGGSCPGAFQGVRPRPFWRS